MKGFALGKCNILQIKYKWQIQKIKLFKIQQMEYDKSYRKHQYQEAITRQSDPKIKQLWKEDSWTSQK